MKKQDVLKKLTDLYDICDDQSEHADDGWRNIALAISTAEDVAQKEIDWDNEYPQSADHGSDDDELVLSDYEKGYLTAYYDTTVFQHMCDVCDEDWFGIQIGERMFDLNAWADEETGDFVCVAYECFLNDHGEWSTDAAGRKWYLTGADNAPS